VESDVVVTRVWKEQATANTKAGPSTPLFAKCANDFARDDNSLAGDKKTSNCKGEMRGFFAALRMTSFIGCVGLVARAGGGVFFPGAGVYGVVLPFLAAAYEEHD
jgi:hypothetical protein